MNQRQAELKRQELEMRDARIRKIFAGIGRGLFGLALVGLMFVGAPGVIEGCEKTNAANRQAEAAKAKEEQHQARVRQAKILVLEKRREQAFVTCSAVLGTDLCLDVEERALSACVNSTRGTREDDRAKTIAQCVIDRVETRRRPVTDAELTSALAETVPPAK